MCTIETEDASGGLLSYAVDVRPDQMVHLRLSWRRKNNIIYRDPKTASKKVKGTLSCVETKIPLPPVQRFTPVYRLHMKFKRSLSAKFASTITRKNSKKKQGAAETVLIEDSLLSKTVSHAATYALEDVDELIDQGSLARIDSACDSAWEECMISGGSLTDISSPRSVDSMHRSMSGSKHTSSVGHVCTVGQLRVQRLHARDVKCHLGADTASTMCCRLSFGAAEKRTSAVPSKANPEWTEVLDFPVQASEEHGHVLFELLSVVNGQENLLGRACLPASTVLVSGDSEPTLIGEQLEGAAIGSTAHVDMEILFLASAGDVLLQTIRSETI